jgi:hypothetical protein
MIEAFNSGGCFHSRTAVGMYDHIKEAIARGEVLLEWDYSKGTRLSVRTLALTHLYTRLNIILRMSNPQSPSECRLSSLQWVKNIISSRNYTRREAASPTCERSLRK